MASKAVSVALAELRKELNDLNARTTQLMRERDTAEKRLDAINVELSRAATEVYALQRAIQTLAKRAE